MKKLNRFRGIGFICIGIAVILEVLGALTKATVLSIVAFALLFCLIIAYLILYRCPYCGAFLGGRYGDAIRRTGDKHICPHCNGDLDKE